LDDFLRKILQSNKNINNNNNNNNYNKNDDDDEEDLYYSTNENNHDGINRFSPIINNHSLIDKWKKELLEDIGGFLLNYEDLKMGRLIGEGAYGMVYEGLYKGRKVAIKQLKHHLREKMVISFAREIRGLQKARDSPYCLYLIGATVEPFFSIVMPFMSGGSLASVIHDGCYETVDLHPHDEAEQRLYWADEIKLPRAIKLALDIAQGIEHLHSANILHRDISTQNILLHPRGEKGRAYIGDFGICRQKSQPDDICEFLSPIGHPRYRAPEVSRKQAYSKKADVWSFGFVLYELCTSQRVLDHLPDGEVAKLIAQGEKMNLKYSDRIPVSIQTLISQCLSFTPKERPKAEKLVKRLRNILNEIH